MAQHLSPDYGLSLTRLYTRRADYDWPALLLHSDSLTWPFNPDGKPIADREDVATHAHASSLHLIDDPFDGTTIGIPVPWTFYLPDQVNAARLTGPGLIINLTRTPQINDNWWGMAIIRARRCRLLVAVGAVFDDRPDQAATALNKAAADGRLAGGTITVELP